MFFRLRGTRVLEIVSPHPLLSEIAQRFLYRMVPRLPGKGESSFRYDSGKGRGSVSLELFDGF